MSSRESVNKQFSLPQNQRVTIGKFRGGGIVWFVNHTCKTILFSFFQLGRAKETRITYGGAITERRSHFRVVGYIFAGRAYINNEGAGAASQKHCYNHSSRNGSIPREYHNSLYHRAS